MASDELAPRSRRALLSAAAGAAGALAVGALIPASVAAAPTSLQTESDNPTTATTSVTDSAADSTALAGSATGTGFGYGVQGTAVGGANVAAPGGAGVFAWSTLKPDWNGAFTPGATALTGVFGFAPAGDPAVAVGTGVWGDSGDTGVLGTGATGVEGSGYWGVLGTVQNPNKGTIGVVGVAYNPKNPPGDIPVVPSSIPSVGVFAHGDPTNSVALYVDGKAHFSRSGRISVAAGKSYFPVTLAGTTTSSKVFAVLATSATGRYVRAVVPYTGGFRVYFNTALAAKAVVAWFVLD